MVCPAPVVAMTIRPDVSHCSVLFLRARFGNCQQKVTAMNQYLRCSALACLLSGSAIAGQPALTIYNQEFAVVRDTVPLDLKAGQNQVKFVGTTAFVEPASVILRDPSG